MSEQSVAGGVQVVAATQLWQELSVSLRDLRENAGLSLRAVEKATGWGRGSLSQIENGKARPMRAQVEWYDDQLGGDGMLVSIFAEARGAHGPAGRARVQAGMRAGDAVEVLDALSALGDVVRTGSTVPIGWTLRNTGTVAWQGLVLRRVGPRAARGLIGGPATVMLPDCLPGGQIQVGFDITMPDVAATLAACWEIVDDQGRPCFTAASLLRVVLVGRDDS